MEERERDRENRDQNLTLDDKNRIRLEKHLEFLTHALQHYTEIQKRLTIHSNDLDNELAEVSQDIEEKKEILESLRKQEKEIA